MSNAVISDDGITAELGFSVAQWNAIPTRLHLFNNDVTPDKDTGLGDLVESAYSGYAPVTINGWVQAATAAHVALATHPPIIFTVVGPSPGEQVFGYYVTNSVTGALLWCERYDGAPQNMDTAGTTFTVTCERTALSEFG